MMYTLIFEEMNMVQKVDYLSDLLGESCFAVDNCTHYSKMTDEQKKQVQENFFSYLKNENIEVTSELIDEAERSHFTTLGSLLRIYKYNVQNAFKSTINQLTGGRKVTIVKYSEFGFPIAFNTTIDKVMVEPYAQYKETLKVVHKPKRKRSLYVERILDKDSVLIYDGWLDIDLDSLANNIIREDSHITVKQSKYHSFDKQYFKDAIATIKGKLIVSLNIK